METQSHGTSKEFITTQIAKQELHKLILALALTSLNVLKIFFN